MILGITNFYFWWHILRESSAHYASGNIGPSGENGGGKFFWNAYLAQRGNLSILHTECYNEIENNVETYFMQKQY